MPTMVPAPDLLPSVLPTERLNERGMALNPLRSELRVIPNVANVGTVAWALILSFGTVAAAAWIHAWWAYVLAFFVMGGSHVRLNILGHEAAHRLLFTNRRANDGIGRWLLAYPTFQALMAYRRSHFAHHRDELGPEEPDAGLYAGYPIERDSWRRKMRRDASGVSAYKIVRGLIAAARSGKREAWYIAGFHVVFLGVTIAAGRPLAYLVWFLSWATLWRVLNRIRAVAEHGGMTRSKDRRKTTHVIRQTPLARMWMVPYNTGWHLAHHVDMGVPWRNLPRLHDELVAAGWVTPDLVYPSYRAFIREATQRSASRESVAATTGA